MQKILSNLKDSGKVPTGLKNDVVHNLLEEFTGLKALLYERWNRYIEFIANNSDTVTKQYEKGYLNAVRERLRINVFSHRISNHDWTYCKYEDSGKSNIEHALSDKLKIQD